MKKSFILIALVLYSLPVFAADHCNALLTRGLNDITEKISTTASIVYKWNKYCSATEENISDTLVSDASAGLFETFEADASLSTAQKKTKVINWCKENRGLAQKNSQLYERTKSVSKTSLQAWNACQSMARKDLTIKSTISGQYDQNINFTIDSRSNGTYSFMGIMQRGYGCTIVASEDRAVPLAEKSDGNGLTRIEVNGATGTYMLNTNIPIRNDNIQIACVRADPQTSEVEDGIKRTVYKEGYVSIMTTDSALPVTIPEVVETYYSTPRGSVLAFARNSCPPGWDDYKPAYGRFIRGVDKSEIPVDPDGRRRFGSTQGEGVKSHNHPLTDPGHIHHMGPFLAESNVYSSGGGRSAWGHFGEPNRSVTSSKTGITLDNYGGDETRPDNVALLYCKKK